MEKEKKEIEIILKGYLVGNEDDDELELEIPNIHEGVDVELTFAEGTK